MSSTNTQSRWSWFVIARLPTLFSRPQTVVCNAECLGNAVHIMVSVFIDDNESGLRRGEDGWLGEFFAFSQGADRFS